MICNINKLRDIILSVSSRRNVNDLKFDDDLFASRVLDSISVVQLIITLEEKFRIKFQFADVSRNSFATINLIAQLLESRYKVKIENK